MKKSKIMILISGLSCYSMAMAHDDVALSHQLVDITVGIESYHETYREYKNDERFMQQAGRLNGFNAAVKYHFNQNHSLKLEGRFAKGKIDYTGGNNGDEDNPAGTPYGSLTQKNLPRHSYDVRGLYGYQYSISDKVALLGEAGLGYRVLKDLSSRADKDDYNRTNKTAYAQVGVGVKVGLPYGLEFSPKISYNHGIYGRQYSYLGEETITLKQHHARGLEVELPISKKFANQGKLSFVPFYRGWKVPSAALSRLEKDDDGDDAIATYEEPKNYTHELGVKLQYTF